MMSSQKVPEIMILRCNGRTYGKAYLITFKVGPLRTLGPSIMPLLAALAKGFFWAVAFDLMSSMNARRVPLRTRAGNSRARSGGHGGWVKTEQAMRVSVRYREAEATIPACHSLRRFLRTASAELARRSGQ
jgi:hypothetical protein